MINVGPRATAIACAGVGKFLTSVRLSLGREAGQPWAVQMTFVTPVVALSLLAVASLIAREKSYALTSTSLMVVTGALAAWYAAVYWALG